MNDIKLEKKECRKRAKAALETMSSSKKKIESEIIVEKLTTFLKNNTSSQKKTILLYYPLGDEVDLRSLLTTLKDDYQILLPVIKGGDIILKLYSGTDSLAAEPLYGIIEPVGDEVDIAPDIVIVPGLAFTTAGTRMGRGKGFYDKFLSSNANALKISLSYSVQLFEHIPTEGHDYKMDVVISPSEVILV